MPKHDCPFLELNCFCTYKRFNNSIKGRIRCPFKRKEACKLYKESKTALKVSQNASKRSIELFDTEDEDE